MSEAAKGSIGIYYIVISEVFSPETTGMIALIETQKIIGVGKRRVKDSLASFSSPCRDAEEGGISVEGRSPRARCWPRRRSQRGSTPLPKLTAPLNGTFGKGGRAHTIYGESKKVHVKAHPPFGCLSCPFANL